MMFLVRALLLAALIVCCVGGFLAIATGALVLGLGLLTVTMALLFLDDTLR